MYTIYFLFINELPGSHGSQKRESGIRFPENELTDSCKTPCRGWEQNPGRLQEQQLLLITK